MSYTQKIVKKSMYWSRHGKHSTIDPFFTRRERKRRPDTTEWFQSVGDLFRRRGTR